MRDMKQAVEKVQAYMRQHGVPATEACDKLKIPLKSYYHAASYHRTKKAKQQKVHALKRRKSLAPVTVDFGSLPLPIPGHKDERAMLIIGDAKTLAEIARTLHG